MTTIFGILTALFIVVAASMVLIILMQRPSGGGLAGAFGGAGGGGTDTVFGGRVGDALTWATVIAFALYLLLAVMLNLVESDPRAKARAAAQQQAIDAPLEEPGTGEAGTEPAVPGEEGAEAPTPPKITLTPKPPEEAAAEGPGEAAPPSEPEGEGSDAAEPPPGDEEPAGDDPAEDGTGEG